jgi:hypothetical protein
MNLDEYPLEPINLLADFEAEWVDAYIVNGIPCMIFPYHEGFFTWHYGTEVYKVHDIYVFDNNDQYIGYMTEDGDLHRF